MTHEPTQLSAPPRSDLLGSFPLRVEWHAVPDSVMAGDLHGSPGCSRVFGGTAAEAISLRYGQVTSCRLRARVSNVWDSGADISKACKLGSSMPGRLTSSVSRQRPWRRL